MGDIDRTGFGHHDNFRHHGHVRRGDVPCADRTRCWGRAVSSRLQWFGDRADAGTERFADEFAERKRYAVAIAIADFTADLDADLVFDADFGTDGNSDAARRWKF